MDKILLAKAVARAIYTHFHSLGSWGASVQVDFLTDQRLIVSHDGETVEVRVSVSQRDKQVKA